MRNIAISEAAEGDVLAANLTNEAGAPILSRGTKLTDSVISRLQKMQIKTLSIEDKDDDTSRKKREKLLELLKERFSNAGNNPFLTEMKRIAEKHIEES